MDSESTSTRRFWTIPNILTLVRIAMIPLIIYMYVVREAFLLAALVVGISSFTDVIDGIIARKFNMVTDIGKIIDPVADKLTQATVIFCLSMRFKAMCVLFCAHILKEIVMGIMGLMALKRNSIYSARWYGKMNTVVLFCVFVIHLIFPNLSEALSFWLVLISLVVMAIALGLYIRFYFKLLHRKAD